MGFAVPFGIKAGIGLGASLLGSKLAGGMSGDERAVMASTRRGMDMSQQNAGDMMRLAGRSFNPVADYWSKILSGNRGAATSMLAPELNRIGDQYSAATRSAAELSPRGGGRATLLSSLPYQQMRDSQSLFQSIRPTAASNLGQVGAAAGGLGSNLLQASTSAGRSIMDAYAQKRYADRALGASLGGGLFGLLNGTGANGNNGLFGKIDDWWGKRGGGGGVLDGGVP